MTRVARSSAHGVYIGRPSKWGNPYHIGRDGTRADVIAKFRRHFYASPSLQAAAREELTGKVLVCYCAPLPCHGDVYVEYCNAQGDLFS